MRPLKLRLQAFGSYVEEQVLDFETALANAPFVLIHGATGTGKTTILDAIVFALYGESSGNIREGTTLRSSTAPPERVTEVEYVFALGRRRFRVLRSPAYERMSRGKKTRRAATGQLYRLPDEGEDGEETLLDSNVTEVSKRIGQLIGFDADQFRQVVLLPQGQFQRFLLAEVKDRSAIMQRIFRTERYQRLEEALLQESIRLENAAKEERAQIDQMLHSENLNTSDELRAHISELKEAIDRHADELKNFEARQKEARRARELGASAEQKLQELAAAQKHLAEKQAQEDDVRDFRIRLERAQRAHPVLYTEREAIRAEELKKRRTDEFNAADARFIAAKAEFQTAQEARKAAEEQEPERSKKAQQMQQLTEYAERAAQLQDCRKVVEELRASNARAEETAKSNACTIENLRTEQSENAERITALEKILVTREAFQHEQDLLKRCQNTAARIAEWNVQIAELGKREESAQQTWQAAAETLTTAKTKLRQMQTLYDLGSAARLAEMLADGAPCPVCGALSHPTPAIHTEDIPSEQVLEQCTKSVEIAEKSVQESARKLEDAKAAHANALQSYTREQELLREYLASDTLEELSQRVEQRGMELKNAAREHQKRAAQCAAQKTHLEKLLTDQQRQEAEAQEKRDLLRVREGEQTALESQIPEEYRDRALLDAHISRLKEEVEREKKEYADALQRANETSAEYARAENGKSTAQCAAEEASQNAQTAQTAYADARTSAGFSSEEEYHAAVEGKWADSKHLDAVRERLTLYDSERKAAEEVFQKAKDAADGCVAPDMEALKAAEVAADQAVQEAAQEQGKRTERWNALNRMMQSILALEQSGAARAQRYRIIGKLASVAAARAPYQVHFQTYVLRSILSDVIEAANARLIVMSRGRYRLIHGEGGHKNKWWGLEIDVFDEYTGLPRVSRTLSGGETFLASLALALGLSDVVQHYAGGMHLDMIFIDEGFGSLDSETLDIAIRALLEVQQEGGRLVGIISHVEELRARIPIHLEVLRTANGSRAHFTQGGLEAL
ncbi:SMC family ATPase [Selenomonas noxia]|uniref:SMC family ATPase n=1 Tax=Selenomonas noxia TaxID=135083 RepID=UPI0028E80994|nr:SMC family ATPase [Selenomonas noxia]